MNDSQKKAISESNSIRNKWNREIRPIVLKRKSAYSLYEWLKIKEFIRITD